MKLGEGVAKLIKRALHRWDVSGRTRTPDSDKGARFQLVEQLHQQRRYAEACDVAAALFEHLVNADALEAYLYSLELLGDDRTAAKVLERSDVNSIMIKARRPCFDSALSNAGARARLKALAAEAAFAAAVPKATPAHHIGYFLHNALPFASGGYALRSHEVARSVLLAGHACTVFPRTGFPLDLGAGTSGLDMSSRMIDGVRYVYSDRPRKTGFIYRYMEDSVAAYEKLIRRHSLDVVHAASNHLVALPAAMAARRLGVPFVYEVRSFWELTRASWDEGFATRPEARRNELLEQLCLAMAQTVITLNERMAARLIDKGVKSQSLVVLPNCVDEGRMVSHQRQGLLAEKLGIGPEDIVIGYVGTFARYEGLDILVHAFKRVRDKGLPVKLLLVGDDQPLQVSMREPIIRSLRSLVKEGRLESDVIFVGRIPPSEVPDYYSIVDICPFPRRKDEVCQLVSPLKPLEALAMEKCVLVSDVGGMDDLVEHGETGLRFESESVDALETQLLETVRRPLLRRRLAAAGRQWVVRHRTWRTIEPRLRHIYSQVTRESAASHATGHVVGQDAIRRILADL